MSLSRESPNSRLNAIRKFLSLAPPGSTRLRLLQVDQAPIPIGEWEPAKNGDARNVLAEEIEQLLIDTACDKQPRRHRLPFLLAWCDTEGGQKIVKEVTVYGHQLPRSDDSPEDARAELDGSTQSQLAQTQRHLEAMMRMHIQWEGQVISTLASTVDRLTEQRAQLETHSASRFEQLLEAKETVIGLEAMLKEGRGDGELTPAQLKAFELAERYLPGFLMWAQAQQQKAANSRTNGKHEQGKVAA